MAGVKFDAHYNVAPDPPELLRFIRANYPGVIWEYPPEHMFKMMPRKRMPPTRMVRWCCSSTKERGGDNRVVVTGIRHEESAKRSKRRMVERCHTRPKTFVNPIIDWTESDVWEFLQTVARVPSCSLYAEGHKRIGCVGCPIGGRNGRLDDFKRWPRYEAAWRKAIDATFAKAVADGHAEAKGWSWKSGADMWAWWMEEGGKADDENQECFRFTDN
jgi:phosphoadenosine phosphosulfate reductase